MTRQKKTRLTGPNGQRHLSTIEIRKTREPQEQSKKKGAGLKAGNRNNVAAIAADANGESVKKDKRIGSKKPIVLVLTEAPVAEKPQVILQPKASLSKVRPVELTAEQELALIENDSFLHELLERVEKDEVLTGKDAKYFNAKTARLDQLLQQLGLVDDADEEEIDPLAAFESKDWRKDLIGDED